MRLYSKAPEEATVSYRDPPASGNAINGLGEKDFRRAVYVFHSNVKSGPLPFDKMQEVFRYSYPARMLPMIIKAAWATFRPQGTLSLTYLFISHDLAVVNVVADELMAPGPS